MKPPIRNPTRTPEKLPLEQAAKAHPKSGFSLLEQIRNYFDFQHHATTFYTELIAGASTYLSLSYIFVLNPTILGATGMPLMAILFATVVASATSTIAMGLWAKLPFAVAPGLEINGFLASSCARQWVLAGSRA